MPWCAVKAKSSKAMATLKAIEITTWRFVFSDDEPKEVKVTPQVSGNSEQPKKAEPKPKKVRKTRAKFDDAQKAEIVERYKAGEGPKAISESLGCSRSLITHIIRDAGVVEGRTGAHLNKPKPEPQPEEPEPV